MSGDLELIRILNSGDYYWLFDYRYEDDKDGIYLNSITYKTDRAAIRALVKNKIKWESSK